MSGTIFLTIDRIVLHDLDTVDARTLAAALQQALADEFRAQPVRISADRARVQTHLQLPKPYSSGQLGRALARSLHGAITEPVREPAMQQGNAADA